MGGRRAPLLGIVHKVSVALVPLGARDPLLIPAAGRNEPLNGSACVCILCQGSPYRDDTPFFSIGFAGVTSWDCVNAMF